jgi:hypothetical protein
MNTMVCLYWILKLKARFLSGDYTEALAAAGKAKPALRREPIQIYLFDYSYYTALTVAALYESASADDQAVWRNLLTAHQEQLREWAENCRPTFGDKYALVSGEIARLEGRDAEAMRLYEQAITSAREHGFVQNEGLAYEVAAGFYAARGVEQSPAARPAPSWVARRVGRACVGRDAQRAGRAAGCRGGGQGLAGGIERDRVG